MTRHQHGISALVRQTSFRWEAGSSVSKTRNVGCFLRLRWRRLVDSRMFTLVLSVKVLVKRSGIF